MKKANINVSEKEVEVLMSALNCFCQYGNNNHGVDLNSASFLIALRNSIYSQFSNNSNLEKETEHADK
jgi:hypothetical protein